MSALNQSPASDEKGQPDKLHIGIRAYGHSMQEDQSLMSGRSGVILDQISSAKDRDYLSGSSIL
jgi:hypothetical protein